MSRKICPVSFNLDDKYEKSLYDHASQFKFSKYVKRLIDKDKNNLQQKNIPINNDEDTFKNNANPEDFL